MAEIKIFIWFNVILIASAVGAIEYIKTVHPKDINGYDLSRQRPAITGRIVNGKSAVINQFPHQVSLKGYRGSTVSVCGGSLISDEYVLTAAHCCRGYEYLEIGLGSNYLSTAPIKLITTQVIEHPGFEDEYLTNDIAIVRLPMKVPFNRAIKPINLPSLSEAKHEFVNFKALVSGFGRLFDGSQVSNDLKYVDVRIISKRECQSIYGKVITDKLLCAKGWETNKQNACQGDSGSPLTMAINGTPVLTGVVSFVSIRGCAYGDPSGFTRVGSYLQWISDNTGIKIRE